MRNYLKYTNGVTIYIVLSFLFNKIIKKERKLKKKNLKQKAKNKSLKQKEDKKNLKQKARNKT